MKKTFLRLTLLIVVILVTFLAGEGLVRLYGLKPGITAGAISGFKVVDTILDYKYFISDEEGLFVANVDCTSIFPPLTEDGFLMTNDDCTEKIAFIGDSFLWGAGASTQEKSFFAYTECGSNYGIPGADLAQYKLLASKVIKDDRVNKVALFFFMGNDIIKEDRQVVPHQPIFYSTNAGNLFSYYGGKYNDLNHSYKLAYDQYVIPDTGINSIIAASALLTFIGYTLPQWEEIINSYDEGDYTLTNQYLRNIKLLVESGGAQFYLFVIPSENDLIYKDKYQDIFVDIKFHWPNNLSRSDYEETAHFNDEGHKKYSDYINSILVN